MCNRDNENVRCDNCIAEILKVICVLQANACPSNCLNSCDRPALGESNNCFVCNTRPVMLYTCCGNGVPWTMPTTKTDTNCGCVCEGDVPENCSSVFRLEKIDGCCATFRVLAPNLNDNGCIPFVATESLFTIDINCICAIRCLKDTFVECL